VQLPITAPAYFIYSSLILVLVNSVMWLGDAALARRQVALTCNAPAVQEQLIFCSKRWVFCEDYVQMPGAFYFWSFISLF